MCWLARPPAGRGEHIKSVAVMGVLRGARGEARVEVGRAAAVTPFAATGVGRGAHGEPEPGEKMPTTAGSPVARDMTVRSGVKSPRTSRDRTPGATGVGTA